jgi:hypothetical protein
MGESAGWWVACTGAEKWLWVSVLLIRASRCMLFLEECANGSSSFPSVDSHLACRGIPKWLLSGVET